MNGQHEDRPWLRLFVLWATLMIYGAVAAPVPGVNEPHYLCKAKHYWQPGWCSRDFFLASPNAHTVFYATVGSLTNVLSLDQAAWVGRALAMLVLAWGWTRSSSQLFLTPWSSVWSGWIYLALASCGNFSGEWLVGGVEGKVFSYGFLFAAWAEAHRHRWILAATWTGLAISFHPVVGIWGIFAFTGYGAIELLINFMRTRHSLTDASHSFTLTDFKTLLIGGIILLAVSLPGLIPVLHLLREPAPETTRYAATYVQVFFRLKHHLDPMDFPWRAYLGYALLIMFWICSFRWGGRTKPLTEFNIVVAWSIVFAVAGIVVGYGPRPPDRMPYFAERMNLLKFYPFRLADLLVPIAVSVSLVSFLERSLLSAPFAKRAGNGIPLAPLLLVCIYLASLGRAASVTENNRYAREDRSDWLDACHWIDANLPSDAVVQSPANGWAFKWFAHRAEYVAFKDCPQDAAGIVEWNRRLNYLEQWYDKNYSDELYARHELRELKTHTLITHLLIDRIGSIELEPVYQNKTFKVFDLRSLPTEP